jgi:hypothetical protein
MKADEKTTEAKVADVEYEQLLTVPLMVQGSAVLNCGAKLSASEVLGIAAEVSITTVRVDCALTYELDGVREMIRWGVLNCKRRVAISSNISLLLLFLVY